MDCCGIVFVKDRPSTISCLLDVANSGHQLASVVWWLPVVTESKKVAADVQFPLAVLVGAAEQTWEDGVSYLYHIWRAVSSSNTNSKMLSVQKWVA